MNTTKWGPPGWEFLHAIAFNYPEKPTDADKRLYKSYFSLTARILPCKYCRESFHKYLRMLPIDEFLGSREGVTIWLYMIHNMVNEKLRKQGLNDKKDPTFLQVCKKYEAWRAKCSNGTCRAKVDKGLMAKAMEAYKKYQAEPGKQGARDKIMRKSKATDAKKKSSGGGTCRATCGYR